MAGNLRPAVPPQASDLAGTAGGGSAVTRASSDSSASTVDGSQACFCRNGDARSVISFSFSFSFSMCWIGFFCVRKRKKEGENVGIDAAGGCTRVVLCWMRFFISWVRNDGKHEN